jgi:exosortase/archaeosortase family protein
VLAFVMSFVLLSGVIGPRIISHDLVQHHGFQVYGWAGKALLFTIATFGILTYRRLDQLRLPEWKAYNLLWSLGAVAAFTIAWIGISNLMAGHCTVAWSILTNLSIVLSVVFAALACFGITSIHKIVKTYCKEVVLSLLLAAAFTAFLAGVYALWLPLATTVLHVVQLLLDPIGIRAQVVPPDILLLDKFGIAVSKYCSGVDSIALFTGLYVVVALVDWKLMNHRRLIALFLPALVLLFVCNILRVFVLITAGYYINPHIAFSLFHTYAGMIFFIIYSVIFWTLGYRWMLAKDEAKTD